MCVCVVTHNIVSKQNKPYNFERLLYYLTDGNHGLVRDWMTMVDKTSKLDLDASWLDRLQQDFQSARVDDDLMCETMRRIQQRLGYLADPHTAVALSAAEQLGYSPFVVDGGGGKEEEEKKNPTTAVLATASPCKFQHSVTTAIGTEGWREYVESGLFPTEAREILERDETVPIRYEFEEGKTLEEVQVGWEEKARQIVAELNAR